MHDLFILRSVLALLLIRVVDLQVWGFLVGVVTLEFFFKMAQVQFYEFHSDPKF